MLVFKERGKPEYPEKNLSEQAGRTNNKLNPHMASTPGFEPGPHREASALTTALPLLPTFVQITTRSQSMNQLLSVFAEDARNGWEKYEEENLAPDVQPVKSQPKVSQKMRWVC